MATPQQNKQMESLCNWLMQRSRQNAMLPSIQGPDSVTVVAYHFWKDELFDRQFDYLAASLRETWRQCGLLKTVLVTNRVTPRLEAFASASSGQVRLDHCPSLVPGDLYSMSIDCILRLHQIVDTDHILIVQNDGFPIRPGLDAFLGLYDYVGAPWVEHKDDRITRFLLRHRYDVGNGGFSLRSRRLCEMTAWYYKKKYKLLPHCFLMTEDYFICKTLPSFEKRFRESIRIAPPEIAATFSLEDNVRLHDAVHAHPLGFHGVAAFSHLQRQGMIPAL